jgi:sigma-B regulation protein RsbU (phosphoserine phosphatase)
MLEAAIHQVAEGVVIVDRNGRFLLSNRAAQNIVGMGPVESSPSDWSSLYGCFRADKVTPYPSEALPLARAMRGEHVTEEEIFIRNPSLPKGAWISVNSSPLLGEGQDGGGAVIVFRNVTADRESHDLVRRLSKGIEKTTDAVFITGLDSVIEYVNPAFETITGYSREESIGQRPSILKSGRHEPGYFRRLWERILSGEVHTGSLVNRRKDGELYHAEQTITPIRDTSGNLTNFVSVMRDVTELKRGQEREIEIRLARTVQQKLFPAQAPRLEGIDLAGAAFAADHTCGDYYDFIPMPDGRVGIAVGDVSGHGFGAALLMAETRAYLRSLLGATVNLSAVMGQLNVLLCSDTEDERFVTLVVALLDPRRRSIVYSSAGHIPAYVLDDSGAVRHTLESTGPPLGIIDGAVYPSSGEISLHDGDLLLLLTDGAPEAQNEAGEFFEDERVLQVVSRERAACSSAIVARLQDEIEAFAPDSPQRDDITAVVCKVGSCG